MLSVIQQSSLKWQLKAEAPGKKKKAALKMDLHLRRLCFPPAREQTAPGEFISQALLLAASRKGRQYSSFENHLFGYFLSDPPTRKHPQASLFLPRF